VRQQITPSQGWTQDTTVSFELGVPKVRELKQHCAPLDIPIAHKVEAGVPPLFVKHASSRLLVKPKESINPQK